jgi:hypothetical protein
MGPHSQQLIFFVTYKWDNKLECYITQGWKGLHVTNTQAHWVYKYVMKKIRVMNKTPGAVFTMLHFLHNL